MTQLAIRCHPGVPCAADEVEGWLEQKVDELRAAAPGATVRLEPKLLAQRDAAANGGAE